MLAPLTPLVACSLLKRFYFARNFWSVSNLKCYALYLTASKSAEGTGVSYLTPSQLHAAC